jgi:uncharacterized protein (TIGR02678 family)
MTTIATHSQDLAERQRAVRALLRDPLITPTSHPEELALVRRHAAALRASFGNILGYTLVVEAGFARLVKDPLDPAAPVRPARKATATEAPFTSRGYAVLALVAAAISAPRPGDQLLISALVEQVRVDAVTCGIDVEDSLADRRHIVAAVAFLARWGYITETDGSAAAWADGRQPEALLTVNRALLPHLLAQPLRHFTLASETWAVRPGESPRRRLRRRLIENPLLAREDLDDDERDVLSRERSELTRTLDEFAGLVLEVRAEGALLYDPEGSLTDVEFPGTGSLKQAALLVLGEVSGRGRPGAAVAVSDDATVAGVLVPWPDLDEIVSGLAQRYAKAWRNDYVNEPRRLRDDVVDLLGSLGLTVALDTGLAVRPAAARYRPDARVASGTGASTPDLFDATGETS